MYHWYLTILTSAINPPSSSKPCGWDSGLGPRRADTGWAGVFLGGGINNEVNIRYTLAAVQVWHQRIRAWGGGKPNTIFCWQGGLGDEPNTDMLICEREGIHLSRTCAMLALYLRFYEQNLTFCVPFISFTKFNALKWQYNPLWYVKNIFCFVYHVFFL